MFRSVLGTTGIFENHASLSQWSILRRNVTPEMAGLLPIQTVPPRGSIGLPFGKLRSGVEYASAEICGPIYHKLYALDADIRVPCRSKYQHPEIRRR